MKKNIFSIFISCLVFGAGFNAKRIIDFLNRGKVAEDVCKLDGRFISPRELQGCEETAYDMMKSSRICEYKLEQEEENRKICEEQLRVLVDGIRSIPPTYK